MVSWTVTRRPFQAEVALAISSPTFLGDYLGKVDERAWRTDKLWRAYQTKRTDLGGQGRGSTDLSSGCPQVDDLNLGGVLFKTSEHRFGLQTAIRLTILGAIFAEDECGDDGRCDLGINSWRGGQNCELEFEPRRPTVQRLGRCMRMLCWSLALLARTHRPSSWQLRAHRHRLRRHGAGQWSHGIRQSSPG